MGGRKNKPKYIHAEARWVATWKNIRKALEKSRPKFLPNCKNLVILTPDLLVNPSVNSNIGIDPDIYTALYEDEKVYNGKGYFKNKDYENIGGILIFLCELPSFTSKFKYRHGFFANENAKKLFSI